MRLVINIFYLAKADKLISDNAFLSKYLEQDNNGGWFVNTDNGEHLNEIKRMLDKNNIKYKIDEPENKSINCRIMKKLIIWLAKVFKVDIITEKVVIKEKVVEIPKEVFIEKEVIKEVIKEVPVEVIVEKEVIKEVPVYKEVKYVALKDEVTNDTYVEGNLVVKGYLYVDGEVSCYKIKKEEA